MILHILGGGPGQLSVVRRCRAMGITAFVTDINPDAPGCIEADFTVKASTFDAAETESAARRFQAETGKHIDALLVTGTDQPVLTAARTAAGLGIPYFLDESRALLVTNKKAMKSRLAAAGIPVAPYRIVRRGFKDADISGLHFPVVSKPLDSQGQRGVYRLDNKERLRSRFDEVLGFSRCDEILVEEYYPSDELTLSGWLVNGRLHILSLTDRVTVDNLPGIGVCIAHHYPSKYCGRLDEIRLLTERIIEAFGLTEGPVYFQYLVGRDSSSGEQGRIIVNETACRLGGAYEDEFIPYITGIDILDVMIKMSCRRDYDPSVFNKLRQQGVVSLQMFFCNEGEIVSQSGMVEVLNMRGVIGGAFLLKPGTIIRNRLNSTQRAGYFIVCCDDRDEADSVVREAYSKLWIKNHDGKNMIQFYDKMLFGGNR